MAPHSSTLAWKIPLMEEPGGLQSMGSLRVGDDWATSLSLFTSMHWRRKWQPLQCSCLENPRDGGAWWAAVSGVAQSQTRLKWLSSSSSSIHWKDWCWSWNSNTLATSCEELTHWKRPWCWERLKAGGEGDDRGWDGWMASLTLWIWVGWTPGVGDGQGGLACCSPWGRKESDTTEQLNWIELNW